MHILTHATRLYAKGAPVRSRFCDLLSFSCLRLHGRHLPILVSIDALRLLLPRLVPFPASCPLVWIRHNVSNQAPVEGLGFQSVIVNSPAVGTWL